MFYWLSHHLSYNPRIFYQDLRLYVREAATRLILCCQKEKKMLEGLNTVALNYKTNCT